MRSERKWLERNQERKRYLEKVKHQLEVVQRNSDYEAAPCLRFATIPELEHEIPMASSGTGVMLGDCITSDDIARIIARMMGISVQSLLKGEQERLVHVHVSYPTTFSLLNQCMLLMAANVQVAGWRAHCRLASSAKIMSLVR